VTAAHICDIVWRRWSVIAAHIRDIVRRRWAVAAAHVRDIASVGQVSSDRS
jgi:hypothetical protein